MPDSVSDLLSYDTPACKRGLQWEVEHKQEVEELRQHFDGEMNTDVLPRIVWQNLRRLYLTYRGTEYHKGDAIRTYTTYLAGVTDTLGISEQDLDTAVRINY